MSSVIERSLKSAVKGSTLVFLGALASAGLWFVTKILIVRMVSTHQLGLYSLGVAVASFTAVIAHMGLGTGITRFVSMHLSDGNRETAAAYARSAVQVAIGTSLLAMAVLAIGAETIAQRIFYKPDFAPILGIMAFYIIFHVLSLVYAGIMNGYGNVRARVYYISIGQPLFFLTALVICFKGALPFISVIYSYVIAFAISTLGIALYARRKTGASFVSLHGAASRMDLVKFCFPMLGTAVFGMILRWTDTLMLGRYMTTEDVGIYNVGFTVARLLTFGLQASSVMLLPIASQLIAQSQTAELRRTYQVLTKWVLIATFPLFLVLFIFPEMTIIYLFNDRFIPASLSLSILSLGFLIRVAGGNSNVLVVALGKPRQLLFTSVTSGILNVLLNYLFIKHLGYGIAGAAAASALSALTFSLSNGLLLYWHTRVQPFTAQYLRPIAGAILAALPIYALAKSLPLHILLMPLYLVLFAMGYVLSLILMRSLEIEDIMLARSILRRLGVPEEKAQAIIKRMEKLVR